MRDFFKSRNIGRREFLGKLGSIYLASQFAMLTATQSGFAETMQENNLPSYSDDTHINRLYAAYRKYFDVSKFDPNEEWEKISEFNVHIDRWPVLRPKAKIVLLHGGGGHGRLLAPIAFLAQQNGIEAVCPDLPGFGLTQVPHKSNLNYEDWREVALAVFEKEANSSVPTFVFGLSMGGMLAYDVSVLASKPRGLIATNLLDPSQQMVRDSMARWPLFQRLTAPVMKHVHGPSRKIMLPMKLAGDMRSISNDPDLTAAIVADPKAGGNAMPLGFFQSFLNSEPLVQPRNFDSCPVLLAHPGDDRWTDVSVSLPFFDQLRVDKRFVMLEKAGHAPVESAEQLQNELMAFVNKYA